MKKIKLILMSIFLLYHIVMTVLFFLDPVFINSNLDFFKILNVIVLVFTLGVLIFISIVVKKR